MKEIFPDINSNHINEFIDLIGLEKVEKEVGVSNQIIAKREIVKSLFEFYQQNDILYKIDQFYRKYNFETRKEKMFKIRRGYFSELATVLWMANQDFKIMPQEVLKTDWYK